MNGDVYSLTKDDKVIVSGTIRIGAAWDVSARGKGGMLGKLARKVGGDLDALAVAVDTDGNPVRMAGIGNNDPMKDGSIMHSGDNTTGKGEGDDEVITLNLGSIKPNIVSLVLLVAAFKESNKKTAQSLGDGQSGFGGVENVSFNLYDGINTTPEFEIMPSLLGNENVCRVARLTRTDNPNEWEIVKLNEMVKVQHGDKNALLRSAIAVTSR